MVRSKEWACLVSLPPANGLGLFVTLRRRERIADCAELILLHAAGNTSTNSVALKPSQAKDSGTLTGDAASWMARARRRLALAANANLNENLKIQRYREIS